MLMNTFYFCFKVELCSNYVEAAKVANRRRIKAANSTMISIGDDIIC